MDWVSQHGVQGDVNRRDLVINKTGLKRIYFKCMHINKEVPRGQHCVEHSYILWEISVTLYANAYYIGNRYEELKVICHYRATISLGSQ